MQDSEGVGTFRLVIGCAIVAAIALASVITHGWKDVDALWRVFGR